MDPFVFVAAAGANQVLRAQSINAHNLANVSTAGFKQDLMEAETVYVVGDGESTRAYSMLTGTSPDLSEGVLEQTNRELDVAISGPGFIAIQGDDGVEGLTRRGDLRIDEFGQLTNGQGQLILGNAGPIALPPFSSMSIGDDGTISIIPLGSAPNDVAVLDRIKLVNPGPGSVRKNEFGVLQGIDGQAFEPDGAIKLTTGMLESSNVNPVSAMVHMIELSRQFEQQMKLVKVGEEINTSSASLMRLQAG